MDRHARCLDDTTLARLLDRSLVTSESTVLAMHLDACDDCRSLVSALALQALAVRAKLRRRPS